MQPVFLVIRKLYFKYKMSLCCLQAIAPCMQYRTASLPLLLCCQLIMTSFRACILSCQLSFSTLQWRFSRVVEPSASLPKEKVFSIATALPMPCYGSLVDDLSNVCLHSEERLPFSQNEFSAQHIAQQLTLLQQVHAQTAQCTPRLCAEVVVVSFYH